MIRISILIFIILAVAGEGFSQTAHDFLQKGDNNYIAEDYSKAEEYYRKAGEKKSSLKSNFNLANSVYQMERFEEASDFYLNAINKTDSDIEKSKAYYNLGNSYFKSNNYTDALEAYKQSIRLDQNNEKARYNHAIIKEMLKRSEQNQQNQENQNSDSQENEDQENQEGENQNEQNKQEENEDQNQSEQQDSTQQIESSFDSSRLEKQNLDSLDAAKLLQIIQSEEQKVQEKVRKFNSKRKKPSKDW